MSNAFAKMTGKQMLVRVRAIDATLLAHEQSGAGGQDMDSLIEERDLLAARLDQAARRAAQAAA